jgi:endo-1,4-beta-xylanase
VVGHFKGQCYSWDVVNEALNENGTFRNDVFLRVLSTDFIPISFSAAAAADPGAKLYYNDFNLETSTRKAEGALGIVRLLQAAGVRIDGVGFQAHLDVGRTPNRTSLAATLGRFAELGVEVAYTELDIAHEKLPADRAALEQQARDYVTVVGSCLDVKGCVGIVLWEFTDKYSWIPDTFPGKGDACLFDANFTKKPAYSSVSSFLAAAATKAPGGNGSAAGRVANMSRTAVATVVSANATGAGGSSQASVPAAAETGSGGNRNGGAALPVGVTRNDACGLRGIVTSGHVQALVWCLCLALVGGFVVLL